MTLIEAARERVKDIWGDDIARENGVYPEGVDDSMIDSYIDRKPASWLLNLISNVLENE